MPTLPLLEIRNATAKFRSELPIRDRLILAFVLLLIEHRPKAARIADALRG
jgi:hypothetical protein